MEQIEWYQIIGTMMGLFCLGKGLYDGCTSTPDAKAAEWPKVIVITLPFPFAGAGGTHKAVKPAKEEEAVPLQQPVQPPVPKPGRPFMRQAPAPADHFGFRKTMDHEGENGTGEWQWDKDKKI